MQILIDLQINIRYRDYESGGMGWWDDKTYIISHCGKQIAEEYGYDIKCYKELNEIDCGELMRFMGKEMQIDVDAISYVTKSPIQDRPRYNDGETSINNTRNLLEIYEEMLCS